MRPDPNTEKVYFYTTSPMSCPYLPGQVERRLVTELRGNNAEGLSDSLAKTGFRRSHYMAYTPACPFCSECISVRVKALEFTFSKSWRRTERKFSNLNVTLCEPIATQEQFNLFEAYQQARHNDGDMAYMDFFDYRSMVEETPVRSKLVEFRQDGVLVGAMLIDLHNDGLSAVYSFYNTTDSFKGFGTFMVLWSIRYCQEQELPYVYLGYLVRGCQKMSYKARFTPYEEYSDGHWIDNTQK